MKDVVTTHGGVIRVESTVAQGLPSTSHFPCIRRNGNSRFLYQLAVRAVICSARALEDLSALELSPRLRVLHLWGLCATRNGHKTAPEKFA